MCLKLLIRISYNIFWEKKGKAAIWEGTSFLSSELSDNRESHAHWGETDAKVDWGAAMLNSVMELKYLG